MSHMSGSRLGPYTFISPLGSGGMGEVYLAEDTRLDRRVALKLLPAALVSDEQEKKRLIREAKSAATPVPYMSPEQVRAESLDARSDIFSFGAVLFEMLSGRRPFIAKSTAELISKILTHEPAPMGNQEAPIPARLIN